ncbi:hypothetical protein GWN26_11940 [Candidatus Saccharibacteria bacterium]|nr:hypothetical protein [Candidatus Saccharibacteria bacterium]
MLHAIGEAAMQHTVRANYDSEMYDQQIAVKKSDQVKGKRPVEKTEDSSKSEMNLKKEEETIRKNAFEDGDIIVEEYNENGEIVRKTPPGYVLGNEMA